MGLPWEPDSHLNLCYCADIWRLYSTLSQLWAWKAFCKVEILHLTPPLCLLILGCFYALQPPLTHLKAMFTADLAKTHFRATWFLPITQNSWSFDLSASCWLTFENQNIGWLVWTIFHFCLTWCSYVWRHTWKYHTVTYHNFNLIFTNEQLKKAEINYITYRDTPSGGIDRVCKTYECVCYVIDMYIYPYVFNWIMKILQGLNSGMI